MYFRQNFIKFYKYNCDYIFFFLVFSLTMNYFKKNIILNVQTYLYKLKF